jgi:ABC-type branched-subunit amino acid transport system substrate-binding protein
VTGPTQIEFYVVDHLACPFGSACTKDFVNNYQAKFTSAPDVNSVTGYVNVGALLQALSAAKAYEADNIVTALETAPAYKNALLSYPIQFSAASHQGRTAVNMMGFKAGKTTFFGSDFQHNLITP